MTMRAPSATKTSAVRRPIPEVAPVMIATLPSSLPMVASSGSPLHLREALAAFGKALQERRRLPQLAVLAAEVLDRGIDLREADRVGVVHRPPAPAREAE